MEKYVEQYQAWGGGLTLPIWPDVQGWQEGNFSITEPRFPEHLFPRGSGRFCAARRTLLISRSFLS
jgi:hypothetical protein